MKLRLYRMGADPEFVFGVSPQELVPAYMVVARTLEKTPLLKSYIGTDNHPATAELRPRPVNDIRIMLSEMSHAIVTIDRYCQRSPNLRRLKMYAQPWLRSPEGHENQDGEHLGGHIHSSVFVDDPDLYALYASGAVFTEGVESKMSWVNSQPLSLPTVSLAKIIQSIETRMYTKEHIYTPLTYVNVLGWLMLPLEHWVQDWDLRLVRNTHYGAGFDGSVRVKSSVPPLELTSRYPTSAYLHYEYRVPSTWLVHPCIAYAYLALVKTCLVNFPLLANTIEVCKAPSSNLGAYDLLCHRMNTLGPSLRLTRDSASLPVAIRRIRENYQTWCRPNTPVFTDAWKSLLDYEEGS